MIDWIMDTGMIWPFCEVVSVEDDLFGMSYPAKRLRASEYEHPMILPQLSPGTVETGT